jgi:hypothetical protein
VTAIEGEPFRVTAMGLSLGRVQFVPVVQMVQDVLNGLNGERLELDFASRLSPLDHALW